MVVIAETATTRMEVVLSISMVEETQTISTKFAKKKKLHNARIATKNQIITIVNEKGRNAGVGEDIYSGSSMEPAFGIVGIEGLYVLGSAFERFVVHDGMP